MHQRLSDILERDVIGPVAIVGERFFDVALGRICLDPFDPARARELAERVRRAFPDQVKVEDRLYPADKSQLYRGILDVWIRDPESETLYLLQITSHTVLQVYERRFLLGPEKYADIRGTLADGLSVAVMKGESPLRLLSSFDQLLERYLTLLDHALQQAKLGSDNPTKKEDAGDSPPHEGLLTELTPLTDALRDAWNVIPWALKKKMDPVGVLNRDRLIKHDETLQNTVIFAIDTLGGENFYEYEHSATPYDDYHQVVGWMSDLATSVKKGYPAPRYAATVARAPSVDDFLHCFPGFQPIIGRTFEKTNE